jgi:hypothetical protein
MGRLALSLRPSNPLEGLLGVFTGYYDESGTHAGSPFTVLAGFVGRADHWARFEREWTKVLRNHNITHLRAKHLFHHQKQHKGWTERQTSRLLNDVLYVVQELKNQDVCFASKVLLREEHYLKSYVDTGPLKRERLDSRYALCLRAFLDFNLLWAEPLPPGMPMADVPVNFVLESGHRNAGDAVRMFAQYKADKRVRHRHLIGSLSFGEKKQFPALQAADLLAYMFYATEVELLKDLPLLQEKLGPFYDYDAADSWDVSGFEDELGNIGIGVVEHVIDPEYLAQLRQNFLAKRRLHSAPKLRLF